MQIDFQPQRRITSLNVDVPEGSFALAKEPFKFETCRERFAAEFISSTPGFYLKHPPEQSANVAAFLLKTEEILLEKDRSKFARTNWNNILWIEPSTFWKECGVRRSL